MKKLLNNLFINGGVFPGKEESAGLTPPPRLSKGGQRWTEEVILLG